MKKIIFVCLLIIGLGTAFIPRKEISQGIEVNAKAPDIVLVSPQGKTIKLSKLKGKIVLIDFWASWCGPCRKENPSVVEAYNKYKSMKFKNASGFEVYSVSLDKNEDAWKKAIADDKLVWKYHGWDKDGAVSQLYQVYSIPSGFLVDGEGNIVAKGQELRGIGLHLALDKLLK